MFNIQLNSIEIRSYSDRIELDFVGDGVNGLAGWSAMCMRDRVNYTSELFASLLSARLLYFITYLFALDLGRPILHIRLQLRLCTFLDVGAVFFLFHVSFALFVRRFVVATVPDSEILSVAK